jgi:hypothetical protein
MLIPIYKVESKDLENFQFSSPYIKENFPCNDNCMEEEEYCFDKKQDL